MTVGRILEKKGFGAISLNSSDVVGHAVEVLASNNIGVIVICDGDQISGIISERDIIRQLRKRGADLMSLKVIDAATCDVVVCTEQYSIDEVMIKMTDGRFRHMPVVRNGTLVGIISIGDVVNYRIEAAVSEANSLREYICNV